MVVRVPRFLVIPILAIGGLVWVGQGIASFTAKPTVTVYAGDSETKVELLDSKQKVEAVVELMPGERRTITTTRGKHTVRSSKVDGTKHESSVKLGFAEKYAVPTSPDQCFALIDISAWYGHRYGHKVDVIDAKIEKRLTKSEPYEFPDQTYGTLRETPSKVDYKDHPKLVTAIACEKLGAASDGEILATLERRLTVSSATLTSLSLPKPEKPIAVATTGRDAFTRLMGEQKPDWMRVYDDTSTLAYRKKGGSGSGSGSGSDDFLIIDASELSLLQPQALADYVANIEKPETKGVYRKSELLPSLAVTPKKLDEALDVGGVRTGFVLRRADAKTDYRVEPAVLTAIGGDMKALASENAKTRFASAKCLAKIGAKPSVCTTDETEATGILLAATANEKIKGKVWFRLGANSLDVRKAAKKPPPSAELDTSQFFTLEKTELTKGAN